MPLSHINTFKSSCKPECNKHRGGEVIVKSSSRGEKSELWKVYLLSKQKKADIHNFKVKIIKQLSFIRFMSLLIKML
ncbi:MAG: hypothetical protein K0S55_2096 [Clostridia bacterium]|nr:hypothetical protein [Clostridia bacterium]